MKNENKNKVCLVLEGGAMRGLYTAGILDYLLDTKNRAISLSMPKRKEPYVADELFPFFYNMLSEGSNKALQCLTSKIDENDDFGLLLSTAYNDTIGAITVRKI